MASCGRLGAAVIILVGACHPRSAPAGAGAVETTPSASASAPSSPVLESRRAILGFPGGTILDVDPAQCELDAVGDHGPRWTRRLSACNGELDVVIAPDSSVYARGPDKLQRFSFDGEPGWSKPVPHVAAPLAPPTALRDSRVVVATSPRTITVYATTGTPSWRFALPAGETLVATPTALAAEGLALASSKAVYVIGSNGQVRLRVASSP